MLRYDIQTKPGLVALLARKRSGSILTAPEPEWAKQAGKHAQTTAKYRSFLNVSVQLDS